MKLTTEELEQIGAALAAREEDYGDFDAVELKEKIEAEIERREVEGKE